MAEAPTPDLSEEVVGWRVWVLRRPTHLRPPRLESPMTEFFGWRSGAWTEAECEHCREVPGERCTCGIYAAQSREQLIEMGYRTRPGLILGEVGLAGRVVVGDRGYRAEKARPRLLLLSFFDWRLVRPLRETFGIPVELASHLEEDEWT